MLPFVAALIWWLYKRRGERVASSPLRWFFAMQLVFITHPLLDAFTVYGTQLWWPLKTPTTMWSSVFIIDPLYTLWLLIACVVAWRANARTRSGLKPAQAEHWSTTTYGPCPRLVSFGSGLKPALHESCYAAAGSSGATPAISASK